MYGLVGSKAASVAFRKMTPKLYNKILGAAEKMPQMANGNPRLLGKLYSNGKDVSLNSFAGEKAITANVGKLDQAKAMLEKGADEVEIWQKTGWFKDEIDGKWKFEINPRGGELKPNPPSNTVLYNILNDEKLYEAYPELQLYKVEVAGEYNPMALKALGSADGGFIPSQKTFIINEKTTDFKSTLYHEIQHAIQEIEGFSPGASSKNGKYWLAGGEVEARNVQKRMNDVSYDGFKNSTSMEFFPYKEEAQLQRMAGDKEYMEYHKLSKKYSDYLNDKGDGLSAQEEARVMELFEKIKGRLGFTEDDYKKGYELYLKENAEYQKHPLHTLDAPRGERVNIGRGDLNLSKELEKRYILKDGSINEAAVRKEAEPFIEKEYSLENFKAEFPNGKVDTPIGEVDISSSQFQKLERKGREKYLGLIKPTLERPAFVVDFEDTTFFFKPFRDKDGVVKFASVIKERDGGLDVVSNYPMKNRKFELITREGKVRYVQGSVVVRPLEHSLDDAVRSSGGLKPIEHSSDGKGIIQQNEEKVHHGRRIEEIKREHPNVERELEDAVEQMSKQSYEKHDTIGEVLQGIESGNYETLTQNLKTNLTEGQLKVLKNDIKNAKLRHIGTDKFVFDKVGRDGDKKRIYIDFNENGGVRINAFSEKTINDVIKQQDEDVIQRAFGGDENLKKFSFETKAAYLNETDPVKAQKLLKKAEYARLKKEAAAEDKKQKLSENKAIAGASDTDLSAGAPRKRGFSDAVLHELGLGDTSAMKRFLKFREENFDKNGNIKTTLDTTPTMKELTGEIDGFFGKMTDRIFDEIKTGAEFVAKELSQKAPKVAQALDIKEHAGEIDRVLEGFRRESAAINANANTAAQYLKRFNTEQSEMMYNALDGKLDAADLPLDMQATYKQIRAAIDNNAKELVNAGALKEENVITDYVGHYYDKYMAEQRSSVKVAFDKFFKRKDLTDAQKKDLGLRTDISFVVANTLAAQRTQLLKAKVLQSIADRFGVDEIPADAAQGAWTRISDETAGGGIKKFGALAGKYVPADVAEALKQGDILARELGMLEKYWFPIIDHIKVNVTVKNPFTHVYNFASNVMLSYLHGDEGALLKFAKLSKDERERYWKLGKKLGLGSALDDLEGVVKGLKTNEKEHIVTKVVKNLYMAEGSMAGDFARKAYAWEDEIFKISRFKKNLDEIAAKRGFDGSDLSKFSEKELAAAMKDAQYYYVDYSTPFNGRLQMLDKLGVVPFLHYSIKSTPMVMRAIAKKPHRFIIAQAALMGFGELTGIQLSAFSGLLGGKGNDEENLAKPDWAESGIIPNIFGLKSWTQIGDSGWYFNSGRLVPGFRFDGLDKPEFGFGFVGSMMKILGEGKSSLGYKLEGEDDTISQRAFSRIKELLKSYAPPLTIGRYGQQLGEQTLSNVTGLDVAPKDYNQDELGYSGILGRGVGMRNFNKQKEYGKELKKVKKEYEELVPVKVPDSSDKEKVAKAQDHNEKIAKMDPQLLREKKAQLEKKFDKFKSVAANDGVKLDIDLMKKERSERLGRKSFVWE